MSTVITVEGLGKKYVIWHEEREYYTALRDVIANSVKNISLRLVHPLSYKKKKNKIEEFWALKEISLKVNQGERIGIIGRNGAGKSTLLKLLSRITEPTEGRIRLKGRVSSLLEVGTGFHPELTGKENIYLNGAILGMSKSEIKRKFDEIVAFSEVEKFLDTPIKRYSSGMQVRLAFSVAAHLEPEILLVDEVLAVGDAEFQKKCLGKMEEVAGEGRSILFVSHNMNAISRLCKYCIWLENGHILGQSKDVRALINSYLFDNDHKDNVSCWINVDNQFNNPWFKPLSILLASDEKELSMPVTRDSEVWIYIEGEVEIIDPALTIGYAIYSESSELLYWSYQTDGSEDSWPEIKKGKNILRSKLPLEILNEGIYRIELIGGLHFREWFFQPMYSSPSIILIIQDGLSSSPLWTQKRPGLLAPVLKWEII